MTKAVAFSFIVYAYRIDEEADAADARANKEEDEAAACSHEAAALSNNGTKCNAENDAPRVEINAKQKKNQ